MSDRIILYTFLFCLLLWIIALAVVIISGAVLIFKKYSMPRINLNKCNVGDKLLTRDGQVVTYIGKGILPYKAYQDKHSIQYSNGNKEFRDNKGFCIKNGKTDGDIVKMPPN